MANLHGIYRDFLKLKPYGSADILPLPFTFTQTLNLTYFYSKLSLKMLPLLVLET